jgi:Fe-Mn family superoxide dismutase
VAIHQAKDYARLVDECQAFLSEAQLRAHFELYHGYVRTLNEIEGLLTTASREGAHYGFAPYSELRRREPVAYNGAFLHEVYFGSLGPPAVEVPPPLRRAEEKTFGSWDNAMADLKAMTQSTHGWALVTCDLGSERLRHNLVHSEHDAGLFANQAVLLAIDCWEHAYFRDYSLRKGDYVDGVLRHLNWAVVQERLDHALLPAVMSHALNLSRCSPARGATEASATFAGRRGR